jgi:MYXO-CTERM domain-containing protein
MTKHSMLASVAVLAVSASASAAMVAGWSMTTAIGAGTTGSNYTYGAADQGDLAAGTSLSAFHALAATTWSTPAGNGSQYSFSSNNWSVEDYYQVSLSTLGYTAISLSWDQTRSSTGPSSFRVDMSVDGGANFSTVLASYTVIQAGATGSGTLSWSTLPANYQSAFTSTLTGLAAADNQSSVIFRFVNLSTVASGGTNRIDNIVISGDAVPAPGAIALLGLAGLAARRRR